MRLLELIIRVATVVLLVYCIFSVVMFTRKEPFMPKPIIPHSTLVGCAAMFLIATACSQDRYVYLQAGTESYVDTFQSEYQVRVNPKYHINSLSVKFVDSYQNGNLEGGGIVIGMCQWDDVPQVTFLQSWWDDAGDSEREVLVFHELGHCLLNEVHRSNMLPNGNPASIMNPYLLADYQYTSATRDYYIDELFRNGTPNSIDAGIMINRPNPNDSDCNGIMVHP